MECVIKSNNFAEKMKLSAESHKESAEWNRSAGWIFIGSGITAIISFLAHSF